MSKKTPSIHLALPKQLSAVAVNPYCSINVNHVEIDGTDVFEFERRSKSAEKRFGLRKSAIRRIADAAGAHWNDGEVMQSNTTSVIYKASVSFRGMDGAFYPFTTISELNIPAEEQKYREQYGRLAYFYRDTKREDVLGKLSPEQWASVQAQYQIARLKQYKVLYAEARAKSRLIRSIFGITNGYTESELAGGFDVERVNFMPNADDPEIRRVFLSIGFNTPLFQSVNRENKEIEVKAIEDDDKEPAAVNE